MSRLGIIAALPAEGRLLTRRPLAGQIQFLPNQRSPNQYMLYVCGIGAQAAALAAEMLVTAGASHLLSWGCAAGLRDACQPGDLYLPARITTADQQHDYTVDHDWHKQLSNRLRNNGVACGDDLLVSTNHLLTDMHSKQQLAQQTHATLADMETAGIARIAAEHGLPFLCIRAIADDLRLTVPTQLSGLLNHYGQPDLKRLLVLMLLKPQLILQTMQLGGAFGRARASLKKVVETDYNLGLSDTM